jgi:multiple sugar transport system ATP-binding protein
MRAELKLLFQRVGGTVVYVTHDQAEAMTLSDRLVVMKDGEIQQVGTPLDVYNAPANSFVARFLGSPAINLIPGRLRSENGTIRFEADGLAWPLPSELAGSASPSSKAEVVLGIRPEEITIATREGFGTPATIDIIEPMGSLNIVYASAGVTRVVATTPPDFFPTPGSRVWLNPQPEKMHLFDPETTLAIQS